MQLETFLQLSPEDDASISCMFSAKGFMTVTELSALIMASLAAHTI